MHVISVVGKHNIGKTRILEAIISNLVKNYRIAVIKHTVHEIKLNEEGTDTQRLKKVGAEPVFIVSDSQPNPTKESKIQSLDDLITFIKKIHPKIDILFIEGFKKKLFPKIVIIDNLEYLKQFNKDEILFSITKKTEISNNEILDFSNVDLILSKLKNYLEK